MWWPGRNWRTYISRCRIKDGIMSLVIDPVFRHFNDTIGREPVILGKNVITIRFGWKGIEPSGYNFLPLYYKERRCFFVRMLRQRLRLLHASRIHSRLMMQRTHHDEFVKSQILRFVFQSHTIYWFHPCSTLCRHRIESQNYFSRRLSNF